MEEETGRPSIRRLLAASCWLFLSFHRLLLFLLLFFFLPERAREPQPAARLISPTRPHFHVVIAQSVGALSTHRSVSLSGYSAPLRVCARATFPRSDRRRSASDSRQWVVLAAAPAQLAASSSSSSSSSFSPSPVWSLLDSQPTQIAVIVLVRDVLLLVFVFLYFVFFFTKLTVFSTCSHLFNGFKLRTSFYSVRSIRLVLLKRKRETRGLLGWVMMDPHPNVIENVGEREKFAQKRVKRTGESLGEDDVGRRLARGCASAELVVDNVSQVKRVERAGRRFFPRSFTSFFFLALFAFFLFFLFFYLFSHLAKGCQKGQGSFLSRMPRTHRASWEKKRDRLSVEERSLSLSLSRTDLTRCPIEERGFWLWFVR